MSDSKKEKTVKTTLPKKSKTITKAGYEIGKFYSDKPEVTPENPATLYKEPIINNSGSIKDYEITVSDYVADKLLENNILDNIGPVDSYDSYLIPRHTGEEKNETNRIEERFAKALFRAHKNNAKEYVNTDLGFIRDYQNPICRKSDNHDKKKTNSDSTSDNTGKIDLISVSAKNKEIYLLELKRKSNEETLLRAVCEIYTYYKQIKKENLVNELAGDKRITDCGINAKDFNVVPAVLIFKNSRQHWQYKSEHFRKVRQLIEKLKIKVFVISAHIEFDSKNMDNYAQNCTIICE